jgi:phosphohistidine phosphatase
VRRLYLLRHAKASRDDPFLDDHERPLAQKGHLQAEAMAERFEGASFDRALVLCSTALRATDTLDPVLRVVAETGEIRYDPALYGASAEDLLGILRHTAAGVPSVLMVGHNPAMHELAVALAGEGGLVGNLRAKFPPGALAVLESDASWAEWAPGVAILSDFVIPADLTS